jgi:hypothetical protein
MPGKHPATFSILKPNLLKNKSNSNTEADLGTIAVAVVDAASVKFVDKVATKIVDKISGWFRR